MSFDNIKLEKGLYTTGKSFTDALERIDPSENYKGTSLEGLDAYERQLKRFDIKVSGANSDSISKFFATTDSAALFPEYISRAVATGVEENNTVNDIVASVTEIDSLDYRSIVLFNDDTDFELEAVNEGAALPEMKIKLDSELTRLTKCGKMISASYEAIKYQKLDLFTTVLKRIGKAIAHQEMIEAMNLIGTCGAERITLEGEKIQYGDLVNLWGSFYPFSLNTIICSSATFANVMKLDEFKSANSGITFQSDGKIVTPFGANAIMLPIGDNVICGIDKNYAVEKVQAGGVVTEFDKLIDRQLERATVSTITGYNIIYKDAIAYISE